MNTIKLTERIFYDRCFTILIFQAIFISRISEGGAADRTGVLQVGDKVLEVSDYKYTPKTKEGETKCGNYMTHRCGISNEK